MRSHAPDKEYCTYIRHMKSLPLTSMQGSWKWCIVQCLYVYEVLSN